MSDSFDVKYGIDDGYVGSKSRPQKFTIDDSVIDPGDSEDDLKRIFWDAIDNDFSNKVFPVCDQEDAFIAWAKGRQQAMWEEDES